MATRYQGARQRDIYLERHPSRPRFSIPTTKTTTLPLSGEITFLTPQKKGPSARELESPNSRVQFREHSTAQRNLELSFTLPNPPSRSRPQASRNPNSQGLPFHLKHYQVPIGRNRQPLKPPQAAFHPHGSPAILQTLQNIPGGSGEP